MQNLNSQIDKIQKEIDELDGSRKYYKLQSEWHRMMLVLCLKREILEGLNNG